MGNRVISSTGSYTGYSAAVSIDAANDYMLIQQSGVYTKINRNTILGVTGTPADLSTVQTFTNKVIGSTNSITVLDNAFTIQDNVDPTKQAVFQASGITTATTRTYTLPNATDTLVGKATTDTLTNKTLTSPTISGGTIDNSTITVDAIAEHTVANGVTVDGMNIKDGKLNTNNSVVSANITAGAVTPASLVSGTGASWAWASWTPSWTNVSGGTTNYAKYVQIGKTVFFRIKYTLGGAGVAGAVIFSSPVTLNSDYGGEAPINGAAGFLDTGVANYPASVMVNTTTTLLLRPWNAAGTYTAQTTDASSTIPFTFGNTDVIWASGTFEAA